MGVWGREEKSGPASRRAMSLSKRSWVAKAVAESRMRRERAREECVLRRLSVRDCKWDSSCVDEVGVSKYRLLSADSIKDSCGIC